MASASPAGGEGRAQLRPLSEGGENLRATPAPSSSPPPPARWQGCGGPRAHLRAGAEARPRPPRGAARQMRSPGRRRRALTVPLAAPSMPPQEEPPRFAALPPVPPHRPRGRRELLRALECVLLGDGAVGKTSLALSYSTNGFPARYVPTALDRFSGTGAGPAGWVGRQAGGRPAPARRGVLLGPATAPLSPALSLSPPPSGGSRGRRPGPASAL